MCIYAKRNGKQSRFSGDFSRAHVIEFLTMMKV